MKSQIKSGAVLSYVNMFINILVTAFYTPFMLRMMGQNEYGLYSLVNSVIAYLSVLDMGFGNAMIRFVSKNQAHNDKKKEREINGVFLMLYMIVGLVALLIGGILFFNIYNLFGGSLSADELEKTKVIMIVLIATISLSFPLSIFDSYALASERFNFLKILDIVKRLAIPATMIPLLFMGGKSITMVIVTSAFTLGFHLITMWYCFKKLKMKISLELGNLNKKLIKTISGYSFWVFLNIIVDNVFNNTDQIILGSTKGTAVVAVYSIASKIMVLNTSFSTAISGLFLPRITKTLEGEDGDKKVSDIFIKVSRLQMYIMTFILAAFVVFGKQFIQLWVGDEYLDAYVITLLLIGPALIPLTQNIGISVIQAKNKHQFRSIMFIAIAILNVAISIPLSISYGGIGAAIGTLIANLLGQIITMNIFYWKKIGLDIPRYWKNLLLFCFPVAVLSGLFYLFVHNMTFGWLKLIAFGALFGIAYLAIVFLYMNKEEKSFIKKTITFGKK